MTTDDAVESQALTMFSFEEILDEIDVKRASAKKQIASWDRLKAVATELAGNPSISDVWPTPDVTWVLEQVAIQGYRGVGNGDPLVLTFDPTPGLTVLHGLNGAGKSSISDAIEIGLTGRTPAAIAGTAGKAALWDPIHLARGAASARVEVTLACSGHRLVLSTLLDSSGMVEAHEAELINASGRRAIELDASWHQALASHQPVFAYASLERRVQLSKDLATYFEGLLALGGSFVSLQEAIADRAGASNLALARWRTAKNAAMDALAKVDAEYVLEATSMPLEPVDEPAPGDDLDQWLQNAGLVQQGVPSSPLPRDTSAQLAEAASSAGDSIIAFENARVTSEQNLSSALEHLHSEAKSLQVESDACPVCSTPRSNWLETLGKTVDQNANLTRLRKAMEIETNALSALTQSLLVAVIQIGALSAADDPILRLSSQAEGLLLRFTDARTNGHPSQHLALTTASSLSDWLVSEDAQMLVDEAVARTDAIKQWQIARAQAVGEFVSVWRADGALAAESVSWGETQKRVDDLRNQLRRRRSMTLEGRAGARIESLLSDADLHLQSINVLSTKASMDLIDQNGNKVDLGMLSAGQRNAVLLAPLLASVDAGPFGFLILDDPVHAFDELRIDRLAESLSQIAESRRVIVLTHDDRLKEYLAARASDCDTRLVDRSNASGAVEVSDSSHFWHELLNDAGDIHDIALREAESTRTVTDALRGLCRMAIDNALRTFTLRNAVISGRDAAADLTALDGRYKTQDRLIYAESFWEGSTWLNPVARAAQHCQPHLASWNQAVHGNPPLSDFSRDELRAARNACKALVVMS